MLRAILLLLVALSLGACQTTYFYKSDRLGRTDGNHRILLMPTDIELSELSASGIPKPNAARTKQASGHTKKALSKVFGERAAQLIVYKPGPIDEDPASPRVQLIKLHGPVGSTAMAHQLGPGLRLPNKKDQFDWTLGPTVKALKTEYGADYGLFIRIRDSYASGERVALILAAALLGVGVQGGQQIGYATLVDLDSGDIVWFNFLFRGGGDLRSYKAAEETIRTLLTHFPK